MTERPPNGVDPHNRGYRAYCDYCNWHGGEHREIADAVIEMGGHNMQAEHINNRTEIAENNRPAPDERIPLADTVQWTVPYDARRAARTDRPQNYNNIFATAALMGNTYRIEQTNYGVFIIMARNARGQIIAHRNDNAHREFARYDEALTALNECIEETMPDPTKEWVLQNYTVA